MAYTKAKRPYGSYGYRKSKTAGRRRAPARRYRLSSRKTKLERVVEAKLKSEVRRLRRGPPRSLAVQLSPAVFDKSQGEPKFKMDTQWTSYISGPSSQKNYALLPITELIPTQRPPVAPADDRFRSYDKVHLKGVSLRLNVNHAEGVRLMVFAFRNGMRRDTECTPMYRPFVDPRSFSMEGKSTKSQGEPTTQLCYQVMTKGELMGMEGDGKFPVRHLGLEDGPFGVMRGLDGLLDWHSPDMTAFSSRLNQSEGGPVGNIYSRVDGGPRKSHKRVYKGHFQSGSLSRTAGFGSNSSHLKGFVNTKSHDVELFIQLNKEEKFAFPQGSHSVNERPLELFVGFQTPGALVGIDQGDDVAAAGILGAKMEVYYE